MSFELVCVECSRHHDASRYRTTCDECGNLLRVDYDTPATAEARILSGATGIARYLPMLPVRNQANLVTMGEGDTPIVPLIHTSQALNIDAVYAKLEYMNPTGSFKDRGNAVQVSVLKETGVQRAAEIGGGNTGHSLAAYCARAGITFVAFAFEGEDNRKVQAIRQSGAEMHWVDGDRRAAAAAMDAFCSDSDTLNLAYQLNAYFIEGNKTMAYEIAEQMDPLPDNIIMAVGNGSQLLGMWWAFKEMLQDGRVQRIPRLHAVQAEAYQPLASAFQGHDWSPSSPGAGDSGHRHKDFLTSPAARACCSLSTDRRSVPGRTGQRDSGMAEAAEQDGRSLRGTHLCHGTGCSGEIEDPGSNNVFGKRTFSVNRIRVQGTYALGIPAPDCGA